MCDDQGTNIATICITEMLQFNPFSFTPCHDVCSKVQTNLSHLFDALEDLQIQQEQQQQQEVKAKIDRIMNYIRCLNDYTSSFQRHVDNANLIAYQNDSFVDAKEMQFDMAINKNMQTRISNGNTFFYKYIMSLTAVKDSEVFRIVKTVSKALYGKIVVCVVHRLDDNLLPAVETNELVAVKYFSRQHVKHNIQKATGDRTGENAEREMKAHCLLATPGHINVMSYKTLLYDDRYFYAVMPFGEGLINHVKAYCNGQVTGRYDTEFSILIFKQLVQGLQYIHNNGICHRDISLENMIICETVLADGQKHLVAKHIDLGLCCPMVLAAEPKTRSGWKHLPFFGAVGKGPYMCPEFFSPAMQDSATAFYDGCAADVFSLGVSFLTCLLGDRPFEKFPAYDPFYHLLQQDGLSGLLSSQSREVEIPQDLAGIIEAMLRENPETRPTINELFAIFDKF